MKNTHATKKLKPAAATVLAVMLMMGGQAAFAAKNENPGVIPPQAKAHGMSYGEWSAKWWQWNLSLPVDQNPSYDVDGNCANGANGQLGPVWFLIGVNASSGIPVRNCTVPVGKALFFPLINLECSTLEPAPFHGDNEAELRGCVKKFNIGSVYAEIDGVPVQNLERYLVESPLFNFVVPPNNIWGLPPGPGQSVSSGYHLMLAPLSAGAHTIHFGGTFTDYDFTLDTTYNLIVAPGKP